MSVSARHTSIPDSSSWFKLRSFQCFGCAFTLKLIQSGVRVSTECPHFIFLVKHLIVAEHKVCLKWFQKQVTVEPSAQHTIPASLGFQKEYRLPKSRFPSSRPGVGNMFKGFKCFTLLCSAEFNLTKAPRRS